MYSLLFFVISLLSFLGNPQTSLNSDIIGQLIEADSDGYVIIAGGTYYGDLTLDQLTGKTIVFKNVTIKGSLTITKMSHSHISGNLKVTSDLNLIGLKYCSFQNITSSFLYLQNYAGWGGIYWNTFKQIHCKGMQVRQAKLKSGTSAINENYFEGLYVRGGLAKNDWKNVWIRDDPNSQIPDHTLIGTLPLDEKWSTVYTNPFVINHFDFSDSEAPKGIRSMGIKHEGPRPIKLQNGFVEHHYYSHEGELIFENVEIRSCKSVKALSGNYDFDVSNVAGKIGNFKAIPAIGRVTNYNFNSGMEGFLGKGLTLKKNTVIIGARDYDALIYEFTAPRTGFISIVVRGEKIGSIRHQSGDRQKQYGLGHRSTGRANEYYVGRSQMYEGEKQTIWILASKNTPSVITGFQVFDGVNGFQFPD